MTTHDALFKELLTAFFDDFLALFTPALAQALEPGSLHFLDKELYPQTRPRSRRCDLVARARLRGQEAFILVHVEHESQSHRDFPARMFDYFGRLLEHHQLPVYPIVIYSYASPRRRGRGTFRLRLAGREILRFRFHVIQLNRLNWRHFLKTPQPLTTALMARMRIQGKDRPRVKAECLRLLAGFRLEPRKSRTIAKFIDSYLDLTAEELPLFEQIVQTFEPREVEQMTRYVTSWERKGLEKGLKRGQRRALVSMLCQGLAARFGDRARDLEERVKGCRSRRALENLVQQMMLGADLAELETLMPRL